MNSTYVYEPILEELIDKLQTKDTIEDSLLMQAKREKLLISSRLYLHA